jgi:hypothetical protein
LTASICSSWSRSHDGLLPHAGLSQKDQPYAGWDGGGRNLTGHIAVIISPPVSLMFLATGDARSKDRADHLIRELKVQDKRGDGYLSALEGRVQGFTALRGRSDPAV